MKTVLLVLALSISTFSGIAQVYESTMLFGKGMLIDRTTVKVIVAVMVEEHELSYYDASGKLIWTKNAEFLNRRTFGMSPKQIIGDASSAYAFGVNSCRSKELKASAQVFACVDQDGNTKSKDVADNVLIPCGTKETLLRNAGFIGNDKLYLFYEKFNEKTEDHTFYLVEVDKDLNHKVTEMPNTASTGAMLKAGSASFPRYAFNNDKTMVYYTAAHEQGTIKIHLNHFDLQNFSLEKSYIADFSVPGREFSFSGKNNHASHRYLSGFFENGAYSFGKQVGSQYLTVGDISTGLTPFVSGDQLSFFTQVSIDGENGSLLATIDLNGNNQTIEPQITMYRLIKNITDVAGKESPRFTQMEFDPASQRIIYQLTVRNKFEDYDYFYYYVEDGKLVPIVSEKGYFIPEPYLAVHQEYLSTDGVYNFPGSTAYEIMNSHGVNVLIGTDKVYITYLPTKTSVLNMGSSTRSIGKQLVFIYPKIN